MEVIVLQSVKSADVVNKEEILCSIVIKGTGASTFVNTLSALTRLEVRATN